MASAPALNEALLALRDLETRLDAFRAGVAPAAVALDLRLELCALPALESRPSGATVFAAPQSLARVTLRVIALEALAPDGGSPLRAGQVADVSDDGLPPDAVAAY